MRTGKIKKTGKSVNVYDTVNKQYIIEDPKTGGSYTTYDLSEISMDDENQDKLH